MKAYITLSTERHPGSTLTWGFSVYIFQSNGGIRSMAIQHFGELIKDMNHYTWMLNPVVLKGLVPLILFLEDTEIRVVNVSLVVLFCFLWHDRELQCFMLMPQKEVLTDSFLSQACKYTLAICVSELKWSPTFLLNDQCYNFEQVVLNFCNNLVSGPSVFSTKELQKEYERISKVMKCGGEMGDPGGVWRKHNKWVVIARAWEQRKMNVFHLLFLWTLIIYLICFLQPTYIELWMGIKVAFQINKRKLRIIWSLPNELVLWKPEYTTMIDKWGWKDANQRLQTQGWGWEAYIKLRNICKQERKSRTQKSQVLNWPWFSINNHIFSASLSEGSNNWENFVFSISFPAHFTWELHYRFDRWHLRIPGELPGISEESITYFNR